MRRFAPFFSVVAFIALIATMLLVRGAGPPARAPRSLGPRLDDVGPRLVSNQSSFPVMLHGEGFVDGSQVVLGPPVSLTLPATRVDSKHLAAVLPASIAIPEGESERTVEVSVLSPQGTLPGRASLTIVNDVGFPTPLAIAVAADGKTAYVASPTTDEIWIYDREGGPLRKLAVGDGPRALVTFQATEGERLAVAHQLSPEVRIYALPELKQVATFAVRGESQDLAVDVAGGKLYVSSHLADRVEVFDLEKQLRVAELPAGVKPRSLALAGKVLAVGNLGSGDVSLLALEDGTERRSGPGPGTPILGGRTEQLSEFLIGGKAPRALAASTSLGKIFVSSIGPNLGPNPQREEVSMNGGIGVIDVASGKFERHVSLLNGLPEGLAIDDARGRLYVANLSVGTVVTLDTRRLATSDETARTAILSSVKMPVPEATELIRPRYDFEVKDRSGVEIHGGPKALALSGDAKTLFVLSRFNGTVAVFDVSGETPTLSKVLAGPPGLDRQRERRLGEIAFFTDLGRTGMSCDACHLDGHDDGVLFEKNQPMRLYRVPTLRAVRETPPYFFPAMFPSLEVTSKVVTGRNRFHHPDPTPAEVAALTKYQALITSLPNPYLDEHGAPPREVTLPDGHQGDALKGLALFDRAGCSTSGCHAPPHFTADQSPATRGLLHDVGTPIALPIRMELQQAKPTKLPVPSLIGAWDNFPLLASGAGGLEVAEGNRLVARPFALRVVLELKGSSPHGAAATLTDAERDDLLAYLLTL